MYCSDITKHPKYEYAFYCKVKDGKPYIMPRQFSDMREVLSFIREIEKEQERRGNVFYIDNSFYKNKYSASEKCIYYRVLKRPIPDWETAD